MNGHGEREGLHLRRGFPFPGRPRGGRGAARPDSRRRLGLINPLPAIPPVAPAGNQPEERRGPEEGGFAGVTAFPLPAPLLPAAPTRH